MPDSDIGGYYSIKRGRLTGSPDCHLHVVQRRKTTLKQTRRTGKLMLSYLLFLHVKLLLQSSLKLFNCFRFFVSVSAKHTFNCVISAKQEAALPIFPTPLRNFPPVKSVRRKAIRHVIFITIRKTHLPVSLKPRHKRLPCLFCASACPYQTIGKIFAIL